ncbi:MAG: DegT/DnrJ/EryC1/StrS family aminotransferase [Phycisphaerae bacterium]
MKVPLLDLTAQYKTIKDDVRKAIDEVCETQSLILGPHVAGFEADLAACCRTAHAVGVSSGTDALLAIMMALNIGPGDEVIVPSFTFFATGGCVHRVGATPVFVDIDPDTFNIDPAAVEKAVTPRTRAIIPVHLFGQMAQVERLNEIACSAGREIYVLEDAAQAIGATRFGTPACGMGFAGALSFYPTKNLGAFGDAGAVCCQDDALAERVRLVRVHGSGHTYYHEMVGGNFRIAAIQAAVLKVKLARLEGWNEARRRHAAIYDAAFAGTAVAAPRIIEGNVSTYNQYVVRVPDRDAVRQKLADAGVGSGVYYPLGLHLQACFAHLGYKAGDLPETERACAEVLALPVYPELSDEQISYAAEQVLLAAG